MAVTTAQLRDIAAGNRRAGAQVWSVVRKFIVTKPLGAAGGVIILLMVFAAIFADVITAYDPYEVNQRVQFTAPSLDYWFGTDEFGRDLFTRIVYGARVALLIGLTAAFIGATCGAILGVISAYLGGRVDLYLQRLIDVLLAFPLLILALAIVTVLGRSIPNVVMAIAIPIIPRTARIVRSNALSIRRVTLAVACGAAIYYFAVALALHFGLNASDLRLITALIVIFALVSPKLLASLREKRKRNLRRKQLENSVGNEIQL